MKIQEVLWKLNSRKAIKRFNCIKTCNKKVGEVNDSSKLQC